MTKLNGCKPAIVFFVLCAATAIAAPAQTFTPLVSFDGKDGANPYLMSIVQGANGNFYGTTQYGGSGNGGTVFQITPAGELTTLYSFCALPGCADGAYPFSGLVLATNGNFYGTTEQGGRNPYCFDFGCGTVFEITPAGKLTTLYSFCAQSSCTDGSQPIAPLVQAANGNLYGTTPGGGKFGYGTVFTITPSGGLTTLYSFCLQPNCTDGQYPWAGLVQAANGNFYGTTREGGAYLDSGTVFEITTAGNLTTLYNFCTQTKCADGSNPYAGLVQATNGNFYGTTYSGGANGYGTVFQITPARNLTTLYSFCSQTNCTDGASPYAGLVQATDGNLYGTTSGGGANGFGGTIFDITVSGSTFKTLYSFCSRTDCTDGASPDGELLQATSGTFYGTTYSDGINGDGDIFSLSVGLGPFVKTLPAAAKVGAEVGILGTKLTGATSVTFNGTPAKFTVPLPSLILTHVPAGATTGTVEVTLPGQTLSSNVPFYVLQ